MSDVCSTLKELEEVSPHSSDICFDWAKTFIAENSERIKKTFFIINLVNGLLKELLFSIKIIAKLNEKHTKTNLSPLN